MKGEEDLKDNSSGREDHLQFRRKIFEYYDRYLDSQEMVLVCASNNSMRKLITEYFGQIKQAKPVPQAQAEHVLAKHEFKKEIMYVKIDEERGINLVFGISSLYDATQKTCL